MEVIRGKKTRLKGSTMKKPIGGMKDDSRKWPTGGGGRGEWWPK